MNFSLLEKLDAEVAHFLGDLDISLGHEYKKPDRVIFELFQPAYMNFDYLDLPVHQKLAKAYVEIDSYEKKCHIKEIAHKALWKCALNPLGTRRTMACLNFVHDIDSAFCSSDEMYSELIFRPENPEVRGIWIWQLMKLWTEWNETRKFNDQIWKKAVQEISPIGIYLFLLYYRKSYENTIPNNLHKLCEIAIARLISEGDVLRRVSQDPNQLITKIEALKKEASLILSRSIHGNNVCISIYNTTQTMRKELIDHDVGLSASPGYGNISLLRQAAPPSYLHG